ncbi:MAG: type IV pilin-like G/H family protein [Nostoc sp. DedVER02]|uniref:type IV pilin-like G/H family protein n=1 Tax=unclassified Nostoc TaxID=2593658 RepID=UPI002AD3EA58|nr:MULTISPECIES: type IV pilin-like G/H family protein [unclassified Nostoc]MDZ7989118.1 type IV pilin-like G/H family protein [Nostoc sp. DedVER02]MDZ8113832.1 type IV pilin-like G/H family protein [Nostoc sp. DedVER01b]
MKTELKAKFLHHILDKKKENEGFTLIELLVVIIIIGILSAIALPSFLNQANKAKQSEAKTYTGSMNRAQQAFYLEQNKFAAQADFGTLGLGIATQTSNYIYTILGGGTGNGSQVSNQAGTVLAAAPLKTYMGNVGVTTQAATSEATTIALLCEATQARVNGGAVPDATIANSFNATSNTPTCPSNFISLSK